MEVKGLRILDGSFLPPALLKEPFSREAWRQYADGLIPGLADWVEADVAAYDFDPQVRPVVQAALDAPEKRQQVQRAFSAITHDLSPRLEQALGWMPEADIVLYLGLCSGAGWVTELNGRTLVLLGMEKILELEWQSFSDMEALLYHELGHVWHESVRPIWGAPGEAAGLNQLYEEGVAMCVEQLLCGDGERFHQDRDGWLDWCRTHKGELTAEYAARLRAGSSVQDFFGDWCAYCGQSDTGYFLGRELVRWMTARYGSLQQAAAGNALRLRLDFAAFAENEARKMPV